MIGKINNKELIEQQFKEIFNEELKLNLYSNILIYKDQEILGFLIYDLIYDRCEIEYIGVLEPYRNKHIASKLMEYLLKENKNISLEVNVNNEKAIKLYKKYGFEIASIRKNYYKGEDAYLMIKEG